MPSPIEKYVQPGGGRVVPAATTAMGALVALGGIAWGADLYRMVGWSFFGGAISCGCAGIGDGHHLLDTPNQ